MPVTNYSIARKKVLRIDVLLILWITEVMIGGVRKLWLLLLQKT